MALLVVLEEDGLLARGLVDFRDGRYFGVGHQSDLLQTFEYVPCPEFLAENCVDVPCRSCSIDTSRLDPFIFASLTLAREARHLETSLCEGNLQCSTTSLSVHNVRPCIVYIY